MVAFGHSHDASLEISSFHAVTIALSLLTAVSVPFATQFMIQLPTPKQYQIANNHLARAVCDLRERVEH